MTPERPCTDASLRQRRTDAILGAFLALCVALGLWVGLCLVLAPERALEAIPAAQEGPR